MPRLLLVDGHSNLYRAFYAIRTPLAAPDGTPTGATFGFLRMQQKLMREIEPTHVGVAFDIGEETFRSRLDERYKAQRAPMPEALRVQVPLTLEALRLLGVQVIQQPDVEADDVIATLAYRAAADDFEVVVASSDKDLMQLVRDPRVRMWHTRHERLLDERGVEEVFGVPPRQVGEVLAIMGDSSDNIPGCPGIGEKGALALIRTWGSVENVYAHIAEVKPSRLRTLLSEHRDEVELSRALVRIETDLALPLTLADLEGSPPNRPELAELYRRIGFTSLLAELEAASPSAPPAVAPPSEIAVAEIGERLALGGAAVALAGDSLALASEDSAFVTTAPPEELAAALAPHLARVWCHDAKALLAKLRDSGSQPQGIADDAMLAGYLLAPGEPVDLPTLCRRYDLPPPSDPEAPAEQARAVATLVRPLSDRLAGEGLGRVYREIELPLVAVLESMQRHGILLDTAALAELGRRLETSLAELEREIHAEAGGAFNINSSSQLADVLFTRLNLPVLRRTAKTKAPSTDAEVLAELASRGFRLPALLLDYREQTKLKSTYVDSLPREVAADGRVHTRFNQAVAATGRLSSSDPNLQNIPIRSELGREVRRAFVADRGRLLLAADYSQVELRVLAHLSGDPALRIAFERGEDIHRATAALVFSVAPELVSTEHRRAAKTINFGLIYGMSAFGLARELGVSAAEAQGFIDAYFARMPKVREYLDGTREEARRTGKVSTMFGRIRRIAGLADRNAAVRGNAERMAINAPVQGTAADLMKLAMIRLHGELLRASRPALLLLQVHDELVIEVDAEAVEEVRASVRRAMEGVAELAVPLKVDIGVGRTWAESKG